MCKKFFFIFIIICAFQAQGIGASIEIKGIVHYDTEEVGLPPNRVRYHLTEPFRARFDGTNWFVRFRALSKPMFRRHSIYEFGWDGHLLRRLGRDEPARGVPPVSSGCVGTSGINR